MDLLPLGGELGNPMLGGQVRLVCQMWVQSPTPTLQRSENDIYSTALMGSSLLTPASWLKIIFLCTVNLGPVNSLSPRSLSKMD